MTDEPGPLPGWLALALVVGTSAAVLVLEILAGRLLAPYVGVSLTTYTSIIGTVLAGIAVGAWLGGVAADRTDARRLVPVLLVTGGALALAVIPTVRWLGDSTSPTAGGVLVLTAVAFLPSATVLSAAPTAVVKLQLRDLRSSGATVGRLSAAGTGGAIVATFLTGFVLVAVAPVTTLIVGVGVLLVVAGVMLWIALPRAARRTSAPSVGAMGAVALVALGAAWFGDGPCDTETAYYCVAIVTDDERPAGRVLVLDDLRHSYVDLEDPTYLDFWYTRRIADVIAGAGAPGATDVVHVGGGAMTVPTWWQVTRPDSRQVVMEIDGDLVDLVVDEFDRSVGPRTGIEVVTGDARVAMADRPDASADVVVGDAFGSRAVPWHLATREFVEEVERVLRPGGVYVLNVIDGPRQAFLRAEAATIAGVLPEVAVVLGPDAAAGRQGNAVVVASDRPIDPALLDADGGRILTGAALREFVADAPELTDGFAPVDQLLLR